MANTPALTVEEAMALKADMFDGMKNNDLQDKYGVSYQIVVGIKAGRAYRDIPWPGGSLGRMPETQAHKLREQRKYNTKMNNSQVARIWGAPGVVGPNNPWGWDQETIDKIMQHTGMTPAEFVEDYNEKKFEEARQHREELSRRAKESAKKTLADMTPAQRKVYYDAMKPREHLPADQADPDGFDYKYTWDEILELEPDNLLVQSVEGNGRMGEAMRHAIMGVFHPENRMSTPRSRQSEQTKNLVFDITKKILKFWNEHPERAPVIEEISDAAE